MSLDLYSFVITLRAAGLFPEVWLCLWGFQMLFKRKMRGLYLSICFLTEDLKFTTVLKN